MQCLASPRRHSRISAGVAAGSGAGAPLGRRPAGAPPPHVGAGGRPPSRFVGPAHRPRSTQGCTGRCGQPAAECDGSHRRPARPKRPLCAADEICNKASVAGSAHERDALARQRSRPAQQARHTAASSKASNLLPGRLTFCTLTACHVSHVQRRDQLALKTQLCTCKATHHCNAAKGMTFAQRERHV